MPELPQMQALAERVGEVLTGAELRSYEPLAFHALKTATPPPEALLGHTITAVGRRGKYLVCTFDDGHRLLIHLSQSGRLDIESPPKRTRPKGAVVRLVASTGHALAVREYGTERKAGWWVLAPGDDGPLTRLGPEATSEQFAQFLRTGADKRRLHTLLRDQQTVAGIGRGYADDILHRAQCSPFATLAALGPAARETLVAAVHEVLDDALTRERTRQGGLSEPKLGEHFRVHGKFGLPCDRCGLDLARVSYESHEVVYCPRCQTGGKLLADRRMSRLLK